jgi:type II secretory pathway predicted ATPase ExeA
MDYVKFFGLHAEPFQNDLDERFYYESGPQRRGRLRLLRGILQRKGLCVLLGGPGLGKTTLAHQLLGSLDVHEFSAHMLVSSHRDCARGWFLPQVARTYGVRRPAERAPDLIDQIHQVLLQHRLAGHHPVLFVDEAQLLNEATAMEEFRAILNLVHDGQRLFTLVLFGLNELEEVLLLDPSLAQRVDVRINIEPLDAAETGAYVEHRLRCAGAQGEVFDADALEALYRYSGGIPRLINTLADNALFEASLAGTCPVDAASVGSTAEELGMSTLVGAVAPARERATARITPVAPAAPRPAAPPRAAAAPRRPVAQPRPAPAHAPASPLASAPRNPRPAELPPRAAPAAAALAAAAPAAVPVREELELPAEIEPEPLLDEAAVLEADSANTPSDDSRSFDALLDEDSVAPQAMGTEDDSSSDDSVDLDGLLDGLGEDSGASSASSRAEEAPRGPKIDLPDDADLDSLFEEIQLDE